MPYTKDTYTGKFTPKNLHKYVGNNKNITYRSSYELRFMKWCDLNDSILQWNSEEVVIPYLSPLDNKIHRYFVDFAIKVKTKHGEIKKYLIEVKPFRFTQQPQQPKRKSKSFLQEVMQWEVNQAKWKFASEYAKDHGMEFMIITEKDLGMIK
jgi:hypothetical protein